MRIKALVLRILNQLRHDKRTLALILCAPLFLLTMIYFILDTTVSDLTVGIINAPQKYVEKLYENDIKTVYCTESEALNSMKNGDMIASVSYVSDTLSVSLAGDNSTKSKAALNSILLAKKSMASPLKQEVEPDITYVYGSDDLSMFDNFGSLLIGFLVFFFVFLIAGISFLQERTTGTLEKLLSTPIKRWEIVTGYVLGFGIVTFFQSVIITLFVVYVLDIMMIGSMWLVLLTTLLSAMTALTLGILLSTAASSEFQMIQFIPIVVVPQVFFTGLFDLSEAWSAFGKLMPLYYVADSLSKVMIRGSGFSDIADDVLILICYIALFMTLNTLLLKRYRRI